MMYAPSTPPPASQSPIMVEMMNNKPMHPISEMMLPMFQDLVIKEYNNPEPGSAAQEPEDSKYSLLELAKEVKAGVEMLVEVIKKGEVEKDSSLVVGAKIAELRRAADMLVEVVAREDVGDFGKVGSGETQEQLGDLSEVQGNGEEMADGDQAE